MAQIAVAGGTGMFSYSLLIDLIARGNTSIAISAPAPDAVQWKKDFGVQNRPLDLAEASPAQWAEALAGCDAVVLCSLAQHGDGRNDRWPVLTDQARDTALEAMAVVGIRRCVLVWPMDAETSFPNGAQDLDCTVLRTGRTLDDARGTNRIALGPALPAADIPAIDAATAVVAVLETPGTIGRCWDVTGGDTAPRRAIRTALESANDWPSSSAQRSGLAVIGFRSSLPAVDGKGAASERQ